jgi:rhamnosyltransferase
MPSTQPASSYELDACPAETVGTAGFRPRVLVLLAAFNGARWIREQMESILAQEGVDLRIVIRDDGSTDDTRWELARFAQDGRIKLVAAPVPGGSAAGNFLTLMAENAAGPCDFIAFADQDDIWDRDKLARACWALAASPSAGYSSATIASWADGRQRLVKPSGAPTSSDFLFEGAGQGCTFVLASDFYERVRRFLGTHRGLTAGLHYHDWLVYALARSWGLRWCFDPEPSMRYRQHDRNDTGTRGTLSGTTKRLSLIRRGWYRAQLRIIAGVCQAAAPANATILTWQNHFSAPQGWRRRLQIIRFCLDGGRRRAHDNLIAVFAALCGWI